tara:strand:- start:22300 stop:22533 length:234 start_codon:yes stop_codon:yes gene_type:complete
MCSSSSPAIPPPLPPVAPPPPPPQIVVKPAPILGVTPEMVNEQLTPDNPVRKKRGLKRRGKTMLKIPLNTSGGSVNV